MTRFLLILYCVLALAIIGLGIGDIFQDRQIRSLRNDVTAMEHHVVSAIDSGNTVMKAQITLANSVEGLLRRENERLKAKVYDANRPVIEWPDTNLMDDYIDKDSVLMDIMEGVRNGVWFEMRDDSYVVGLNGLRLDF